MPRREQGGESEQQDGWESNSQEKLQCHGSWRRSFAATRSEVRHIGLNFGDLAFKGNER